MQDKRSRAVITVDGLAASGKSALSAQLAKRTGYLHFSSGALYRAVGLLILQAGIDPSSASDIVKILDANRITLKEGESPSGRVLINGADPGAELFRPEVSVATSVSSALREVRQRLLPLQRSAFESRNLVAEGRDMGTVVFPDAPLKFFITADQAVRSERRVRQAAKNAASHELKLLKEKIEMEIAERDKRDSERAESPTKAASGAILVDNSRQTLTEVVDTMYYHVLEKGLPIA